MGIAGHKNFEEVAKYTELFEHSGSLVACAIAGVIGYFLYPNVLPIFYVIGGFGTISTIGLLFMRRRKSSSGSSFEQEDSDGDDNNKKNGSPKQGNYNYIDDDMARNTTYYIRDDNKSNNDDNDEEQEEIKKENEDSTTSIATSSEAAEQNNESQYASLWTIFVGQRNLAYFSLAVFFFHLGNAAVLPLLGQVLALDDGKAGIPYTAANIGVAQLSSFMGVYMLEFLNTKKGFSINLPISIGFGALVPRIGLILLILRYNRNPYALIATQVLDGIGAGVNGLSIMRVAKTCTEGTGRFGVVFSIVTLSWAVGAALSNLISGYVIDAFSYEVGFYCLLPYGFLSVLFVYLTKVVPPPRNTIEEVESSLEAIEKGEGECDEC